MKRPADGPGEGEFDRYGGPPVDRGYFEGGMRGGRGGRRGGGRGGFGGRGRGRGPPMPLDGPIPLDGGPMGPPPMYPPMGPRGVPPMGPPRAGPPGLPIDLQKEPNITQEIIVPRKRTGVILGPGGETASQIRRQCRCQLHVRKEHRPDDTQAVEISGSLMQIRAGVDRVREILLAEDKEMPISVPSDAFSYIDVLPEMVGYVLGSRGSTVKTLKEKTSTQIQITDINPDTGLQAILIKGKPENITEAHHTIVKMLERYDPRRTRPPPIGVPGAPPALMGPPGYGPPPPGYGPDPYAPPGLEGPMGPPGYGPPPYGYPGDELEAPPPYVRGRERYGSEDPWGPPRAAPAYPGAHAPAYGAPVQPAPAPAAPVGGAPGADPGVPQVLVLQPDGTYRPAQVVMPGGYGQPAPAPQPAPQPVAASQPLALSAAMALHQPQQPLAYTSAAMSQPQYQPQYQLPAQPTAVPAQPQASPAPAAQPQPAAAPVALPSANGAAAAQPAGQAGQPSSGSMTLQQMQQYYSMYAQMYQQAQQQMQQQPAPQ